MIQFNLLPDIKLDYIKAMRVKRTVAVVSTLAAIATLSIMLILLAVVKLVQKHEIASNNAQISTYINQVQSIPSLDQILTVQNQVSALPNLYNQDPVASRVFSYITELTPAQATISQFSVSFSGDAAGAGSGTNTISIQGDADSLNTIQDFVDTLKFSKYGTATSTSSTQSPFSDVVLTSFGFNTTSGASYTINATFSPTIFERQSTATLTVPNLITTRSQLDQPQVLFQPQPATTKTTTNN